MTYSRRLGISTSVLIAFLLTIVLQTLPKAYADIGLGGAVVKNGRIAYSSDSNDGNFEIYTMNSDGTDIKRLTTSAGDDRYPSWSPDGSKIAFVSSRDGDDEIFTMNYDGSSTTQLTSNGAYDRHPDWSPDGSKIAFDSYRDGNDEIYVMSGDGSGQTNITNDAATDNTPSWSSSGTSIFYSTNKTGDVEIFSTTVSAPLLATQITTAVTSTDDEVSVSPDGSKILITSNRTAPSYQVFMMDSDGINNIVQITTSGGGQPEWSPDGTKIVYGYSGNLFTIPAAGGSPTNISNNPPLPSLISSADASWQPVNYSASTTSDGVTTNTITDNKSTSPYTVANNEILIVSGQAGPVTVNSGGVLKGTGTVGAVTINSGGKLAPGTSPGCLATGNLTFNSGSSYEAEIAGTTACTQYDQTNVTGAVTLGNATLTTALLNGFTGSNGNVFTIINNDLADAVSGTFNNLAEGATFTVGTTVFKISYAGGDGNDVTLTIQNVPTTPNTGLKIITSNPLATLLITTVSAATLVLIAKRTHIVTPRG